MRPSIRGFLSGRGKAVWVRWSVLGCRLSNSFPRPRGNTQCPWSERQGHCSQHTGGFLGLDTSVASVPGGVCAPGCRPSGSLSQPGRNTQHSRCIAATGQEEEVAEKEQSQEEDTEATGRSCPAGAGSSGAAGNLTSGTHPRTDVITRGSIHLFYRNTCNTWVRPILFFGVPGTRPMLPQQQLCIHVFPPTRMHEAK